MKGDSRDNQKGEYVVKEYFIRMPFAGYVDVTVEAENEEGAKEKFWELGIGDLKEASEKGIIDNYEWDFYETIVQGNVLHVPQNEMEIEEV